MKKLLYIGCALITLGIIVFAIGFFASGSDIYALDIETKYFLIDLDGSRSDVTTVSDTFLPSEVESIDISDTWHNVEFGLSSDNMVHVIYAQDEFKSYDVSLNGGALSVDYSSQPGWDFKLVSINFGKGRSTDLQVLLPEGFKPEINVKTTSGDVDITSASSSLSIDVQSGNISIGSLDCQSLRVSSSSGDMDLGDLTVDGNCTLETISGNINTGKVCSQSLYVYSTSGSMYMESSDSDEFTARSTSGDIEIGQFSVDISAQLSAVSGDIWFTLDGVPESYFINAASNSGDIDLPAIHFGGDINISVNTTSGNIDIQVK